MINERRLVQVVQLWFMTGMREEEVGTKLVFNKEQSFAIFIGWCSPSEAARATTAAGGIYRVTWGKTAIRGKTAPVVF